MCKCRCAKFSKCKVIARAKMYLYLFRKKYILVEAIRKHFYTFSSEMSIQRGVYTNRQKS